ncbi:hypothetical protein ACEW7V_00310 [Areca yellow leaf disease phytoplasma]|uniref:hypothetical protein n=1 Tax=Areca yellow leaf disease phytoplasma TaxID=927614 RepID=UPI0035B5654E
MNNPNTLMVVILTIAVKFYPKLPKSKKCSKTSPLPTQNDWHQLKQDVMQFGLYNSFIASQWLQTAQLTYYGATPLTPVKQLVEERTYGNSKTYCSMPALKQASLGVTTAYKNEQIRPH